MGQIIDYCSEYITGQAGHSWNWFNGLNREEWMVVLAFAAASGFICLLGFKTRK